MTETNEEILKLDWVKELLARPVLARLGTASPKTAQPHVTPVWFEWDGENLYISAFVSTRKGREVTSNPLISVLIDVENPTQAILMEGKADVLSDPEEVRRLSESIYARYVGVEEVKKDPYLAWTLDPENRVIRLRPARIFKWNW